jgi:hypothetical protein
MGDGRLPLVTTDLATDYFNPGAGIAASLKAAKQHVCLCQAFHAKRAARGGASAARTGDVELVGENSAAGLVSVFNQQGASLGGVQKEISEGGTSEAFQFQQHSSFGARPVQPRACFTRAVSNELHVGLSSNDKGLGNVINSHREMNDRALAAERVSLVERLLDCAGIGSHSHLYDLPYSQGRGLRQDRGFRVDVARIDDLFRRAVKPTVLFDRVGGGVSVAHEGLIAPGHFCGPVGRAGWQFKNVIHYQIGAAISESERIVVRRIEDAVAAKCRWRTPGVTAFKIEEPPGADTGVVHEGEDHEVLGADVGNPRAQKKILPGVKVAGGVEQRVIAVLEARIPDPDVHRIETGRQDTRLRAAKKSAPEDFIFGLARRLIAPEENADLRIAEDQVARFIVGGESRTVAQRGACPARAINREAGNL